MKSTATKATEHQQATISPGLLVMHLKLRLEESTLIHQSSYQNIPREITSFHKAVSIFTL